MTAESLSASIVSLIPAPPEDLCLHFVNTRYWRGSGEATETLLNSQDLKNWIAESAGLPAAALAKATAAMGGDCSEKIFADAIALRESLYRVFGAIAAQAALPDADLGRLNEALADAPSRARLVHRDAGAVWAVRAIEATAADLLTPVIWSAADLLAQTDHRRVRRCANDKCLWLFIDRSKAGTRRWCDMKACGNRAKSHRHYARLKLA